MRVTVELPASAAHIEALLEGLVLLNVELLDRSPLPPLVQSGVVWKREPRGREDWNNCERTFRLGWGDCEDVCAWRAAELRRAGELAARCVVRRGRQRKRSRGPRMWHVLVERADGTIEDISRVLGMGRNVDA